MVCPMKLTSVQRAPLWSGTALQGLLGIGAPGERIGEDLVLAVHSAADTGEPDCRVENGMFAGMRLRDVPGVPDPFPLLIKLIDAGEDLSLQVHPSDPGTEGGEKTEMWLILHAEQLVNPWLEQGKEPCTEILPWLERWQNAVLITQEVGCGLVPVTPQQRQLREAVGRFNRLLAECAETVERVCCGLGMRLK